ncbi:MAG: hypothetical protein OET79_08530, partial [Nitrospirota bacterium]|nr:hypothetical protein [Nitrospirota bacterium]
MRKRRQAHGGEISRIWAGRLESAATERSKLQIGETAQAVEVEKGASQALVFSFLAPKFGGGNQADSLAVAHGLDDPEVGTDGLRHELLLFIEAKEANVGVGHLGGDEEAAGVEIPEGSSGGFLGGAGSGAESAEEIDFPRSGSRTGPWFQVGGPEAGHAEGLVSVNESGAEIDGGPGGGPGLPGLGTSPCEARPEHPEVRVVREGGCDAGVQS